jgi:hypothetical protein
MSSRNWSKKEIVGADFEKYILNIQRNPRASRLDYLDLVYPKRIELSTLSYTAPCYHREGAVDHVVGTSKTDPQLNLIVDLCLGLSDNSAIAYDRSQLAAQYLTQKVLILEEKLAETEKGVRFLVSELPLLITKERVIVQKVPVEREKTPKPDKESSQYLIKELSGQVDKLASKVERILSQEGILADRINKLEETVQETQRLVKISL